MGEEGSDPQDRANAGARTINERRSCQSCGCVQHARVHSDSIWSVGALVILMIAIYCLSALANLNISARNGDYKRSGQRRGGMSHRTERPPEARTINEHRLCRSCGFRKCTHMSSGGIRSTRTLAVLMIAVCCLSALAHLNISVRNGEKESAPPDRANAGSAHHQ